MENWEDKFTMIEIVPDVDLDIVFQGTNYGAGMNPRQIVNQGLLKCSCSYATGYTTKCILLELGLIKNNKSVTLTRKGKRYLYEAYEGSK